MTRVLELDRIDAGYGETQILHGVSFHVDPGEIVVVIGPNGAGKSTAMKAVFGMLNITAGTIRLTGEDITSMAPQQVVRHGVAYVPQVGNVFVSLSVEENLEMGAYVSSDDPGPRIEEIYGLFPPLREKQFVFVEVKGLLDLLLARMVEPDGDRADGAALGIPSVNGRAGGFILAATKVQAGFGNLGRGDGVPAFADPGGSFLSHAGRFLGGVFLRRRAKTDSAEDLPHLMGSRGFAGGHGISRLIEEDQLRFDHEFQRGGRLGFRNRLKRVGRDPLPAEIRVVGPQAERKAGVRDLKRLFEVRQEGGRLLHDHFCVFPGTRSFGESV